METNLVKGQWYKLTEAAQLLGVSEITVRRKAKAGQVKAVLRNGKYLVYLEEDKELGLFVGLQDDKVMPTMGRFQTQRTGFNQLRTDSRQIPQGIAENQSDELIHSLKRTIADQQTLIASLEDSILRLRQKLSSGQNSSR
ncbi:MAG: hypothetical protein RJB13_2462 [Pseudomonadota bacterium]